MRISTFPTFSRSRSARSDAFDSADPENRRGSLAFENPRWRLLDCRVEEIEEEGERSSIDGGRGGTRARAGSADFRLRIDELYLLNRLEEERLRPLYRIPTT